MHPGNVLSVSAVEIRDQLRAITQSALFAQSRRQAKLLEYLCSMVLLGRSDEIKEYTLAVEVFERPPEFDDKKDAIVRVEVHRLRQRLAKYYATEGAQDRVRIELAPGSYVPKFGVNGEAATAPVEAPVEAPAAVPHPGRRHLRWIIGAAAGAAAVVVIAVLTHTGAPKAAPREAIATLPAAAALPPEGIRILAGSQTPYIDRAGHHWSADTWFKGGTAQAGPSDFLGRPPDPSLYRWMRSGDFSYDIPAPSGYYELRLHFAEPTFRAGTDVGSEGGENQRHFTVTANGATLLDDFDVVTDSGMFPVDVRAFRDITPAEDGQVHLKFRAVMGPAFVNAIELVPGVRGHALPVRIRAGPSSVTDHAGNVWSPDDYFAGGRLATHKGNVTNTADPDLFAGERYGNFSYAIAVPPGRYAVTLYFAETFWDPHAEAANKGGAGMRVFNVYCNGETLLADFDMLKEGAAFQPIVRTFHNLRPNAQGKLLLAFTPVVNYASVKAIEVVEESRR